MKRPSELPRVARKRSKIDPQALPIAFGDANGTCERLGSGPGGSWSVSGAPRGRFWKAPGRSWSARGVPRSAWGGIWASKSHPERVRTHPPNDLERLNRLQIDFFGDFGIIFIDFREILRRCSHAPPATKAPNQNRKKAPRDPHPTSGLWPCAVASCCPCVFRNGRRTLYVLPFFVAYPQDHLLASHNAVPGPTRHRANKTNPNLDNYNRTRGQPNDSSMDIDGSTLVYIRILRSNSISLPFRR